MSSRRVTIDTNFFITLFSNHTDRFKEFNEILRRLKIKIVLSNYVTREMRWYMERVIAPLCEVIQVNRKKLEAYEREIRPRVGKLPQTPDVSVAYIAEKEKIPLVSSDLKLIQISQKLGIETYMNSAFAIWLMDQVTLTEDKKFIEECYRDLFAEEISYSVKSQNVYDPVIRIQAIMNSALDVVRRSKEVEKKEKKSKGMKKFKPSTEFDFSEYRELYEMTKGYRRDLDVYLKEAETGSHAVLFEELQNASYELLDLCSEVRLLGVPETDEVYKGALTTLAHLLLLQSTVAIGEHKISEAESAVDLLLLLTFELKEVAEMLDVEVHLQRILLFFLTQQIKRLKIYFTPAFYAKCQERGREDIIDLLRTFGILSAVIVNSQAEKSATVKDFSEIEFTMQLGFQFITVGKPKIAWLLLEQAVYMALNSQLTGLLFAVLEVLLPLHFTQRSGSETFSPTIYEILDYIKETDKDIPIEPYYNRLELKEHADPSLLIRRAKSVKSLPESLRGFLDVISAESTKFRKIGEVTLVTVIDWQTMNLIGIVDPTKTLEPNLTVGASVQIHSGKVRLIEAPSALKKNKGINMVIICKPDKLQFILRRSGHVTISESHAKIEEYDLD